MSLAVQLYAGYLATHPLWAIAYALGALSLAVWVLAVTLTDGPRMAYYRECTTQELDDLAAMGARNHPSPPAGSHHPFAPAGDVPGPASMRSPGADGVSSAVLAAGPGTNRCPWEQALPPVPHVHDDTLWSMQPAIQGGK